MERGILGDWGKGDWGFDSSIYCIGRGLKELSKYSTMCIVCVGLSVVFSLMEGSPISNRLFSLSLKIGRFLGLEACFFCFGQCLLLTRNWMIARNMMRRQQSSQISSAVTEVQIGAEDLEDEDCWKYDIITAVLPAAVEHIQKEKAGEELEE